MEKEERINEIGGMLEDTQQQLVDMQSQLDGVHDRLVGIQRQLTDAQNEVFRITHNIVTVVEALNEAHVKLLTGK